MFSQNFFLICAKRKEQKIRNKVVQSVSLWGQRNEKIKHVPLKHLEGFSIYLQLADELNELLSAYTCVMYARARARAFREMKEKYARELVSNESS